MNPKQLVRLTNIVGMVSFVLLMYWIFAFILIQVFDLKIFRQHLSEIFMLSSMGIIALMAGALMLNIMFNLTRIAERGNETVAGRKGRMAVLLMVLLFPVLAGLLFAGNYLSLQRREQVLQQAAQALLQNHAEAAQAAAHYRFTPEYVRKMSDYLNIMEKTDTAFRSVMLIVPDRVDGSAVYIRLTAGSKGTLDEGRQQDGGAGTEADKRAFIYSIEPYEREYLHRVFAQNLSEPHFVQRGNHYYLYVPQQNNGKTTAVLLFTDYYQYGKYGS